MNRSGTDASNRADLSAYAALYARVSTEDQGKGFSIPTQIEACRKLAEREGYTVPETHVLVDEGLSGTTMGRPGLRRLRELIQTQAITAVMVIDPDRLSRNLGHQLLLAEELERAGVKLLIVSHPMEQGPEGWLFFQMSGALAEYERAKILERTQRGRLGRAKAGYVNGGRVPLGYRYVSAPHQGTLVIVDDEAAIVRQIFQWAHDGLTIRAIGRRLTDARIPTASDRRGFKAAEGRKPCKQEAVGVWSISSIGLILRNPVYKGQMHYNARATVRQNGGRMSSRWRPREEWLTVPVPAIIDEELFATVQRQIAENLHRRPQWKGSPLLRGRWFRCGRCGLAMAGLNNGHHRYYRCSSWQSNLNRDHRCGGLIRDDKADQEVCERVRRFLEDPKRVAVAMAERQATIHEQESAIDAELRAVESGLARCGHDDQRLVEAYVAGAFTPAELKAYRADLASKRQSLEVHGDELRAQRQALQHRAGELEALLDRCAQLRRKLQTCTVEEKHRVFTAMGLRINWLPKQPLIIQAWFHRSWGVEPSRLS
jgi:site-specific DNA recombinase